MQCVHFIIGKRKNFRELAGKSGFAAAAGADDIDSPGVAQFLDRHNVIPQAVID
jgi:hypothetical protein